jgi:hypothetical protein
MNDKHLIGEKISPILEEIEGAIIDFDYYVKLKPNYSIEGFRAATKIFMSALMDKMYDLQEKENIPVESRLEMANKAGEDLRKLINTYTGIDTYKLYSNGE